MTPAELFTQIGRALFGERWKADIEHVLKIRPGRADDWSKGHGEPPPGVWVELVRIIADRRKLLPALQTTASALSNLPPPRIYECTNGRKISVKADADGSYPDVYYQTGTGFWEPLGGGERAIPLGSLAFRIQRGQEIGRIRKIEPKYFSGTQKEQPDDKRDPSKTQPNRRTKQQGDT